MFPQLLPEPDTDLTNLPKLYQDFVCVTCPDKGNTHTTEGVKYNHFCTYCAELAQPQSSRMQQEESCLGAPYRLTDWYKTLSPTFIYHSPQ